MKENMLAMNKKSISIGLASLMLFGVITISSCGEKRSPSAEFARNMYDPIAYNPDQENPNFKNGQTAQTPPKGTMPIGMSKYQFANTPEGYLAASASLVNPLELTEANLAEGKSLYLSMCSHCHGALGKGDGAIIEAGKFPPPPSYSTGVSSRGGDMKNLTDGKIYHTIVYGLNLMGSHASQLSPKERWQIVMYVHELQKQ